MVLREGAKWRVQVGITRSHRVLSTGGGVQDLYLHYNRLMVKLCIMFCWSDRCSFVGTYIKRRKLTFEETAYESQLPHTEVPLTQRATQLC